MALAKCFLASRARFPGASHRFRRTPGPTLCPRKGLRQQRRYLIVGFAEASAISPLSLSVRVSCFSKLRKTWRVRVAGFIACVFLLACVRDAAPTVTPQHLCTLPGRVLHWRSHCCFSCVRRHADKCCRLRVFPQSSCCSDVQSRNGERGGCVASQPHGQLPSHDLYFRRSERVVYQVWAREGVHCDMRSANRKKSRLWFREVH